MRTKSLRQITIDTVEFDSAFNRDVCKEVCPEDWRLDCVTGDVLSTCHNDEDAEREWGVSAEDNARYRRERMHLPKRFLELGRDNMGGHVHRENMPEVEYNQYMKEVAALLAANGVEAIWK